jgi:hypothetical protein
MSSLVGLWLGHILSIEFEEGFRFNPPGDAHLLIESSPLLQLLKAALTPLEVMQWQLYNQWLAIAHSSTMPNILIGVHGDHDVLSWGSL